jgi:hypothetical protein
MTLDNKYTVYEKIAFLLIFSYPMGTLAIRDTFGFSLEIRRLLVFLLLFIFVCSWQKIAQAILIIRESKIYFVLIYSFLSLLITYFIFAIKGLVPGYAENITEYQSILRTQAVWPVVQYISYIVTAVIPFVLLSSFNIRINIIIKALNLAFIVIVLYGALQLILYQLFGLVTHNLGLIGGDIHGVPTQKLFGYNVIRVYSLAGEPKMLAAYLISSSVFFAFTSSYSFAFKQIILMLTLAIFISTSSTSAYLSILLILIYVSPLLFRNFIGFIIFLTAILIGIVFFDVIENRVIERIISLIEWQGTGKNPGNIYGLSVDGSVFLYINQIFDNYFYLIFGHGWGNLMHGLHEIILDWTSQSIETHTGTRLLGFQYLVEMGLVGLLLILWFFRIQIVKIDKLKQILSTKSVKDYRILVGLKYAIIAAFISSLIEVQFYAYIYLALFYQFNKKSLELVENE